MIGSDQSTSRKKVTAQLVSTFILPRLDYCNALLAGLPRATTDPLQQVQNAAARLVLNLRLRDHVTPPLKQPHWLPVASTVRFKLWLLMHLIHTRRAPKYLVDSVQSVITSSQNTWDRLKQQTTSNVLHYYKNKVRRTWLQLLWPSSMEHTTMHLRTITDTNVLKRHLKAFLFTE